MTVDNNLPSPNGNIVSTSSTEIIRVLHVDDEEDQQMFLKVFVEGDSNIKITSARSAEETLELVETGAFDCLVSDYDMPDMDGITLAKKIRETSNIPIIIYTGRGSEEVAESAFASGIDDYIRKELTPAHYQLVSKRIRQAVERRRSNESYRNLFDSASDAISIVAFDGRIIDINEVGCKMLGYSKEAFLRMTINNYVASPGFDFNDYLEKIVRKGHSVFEATHITREGKLIPVEVNAKVIKYMGVDAILSFSRDISDRKRLEAQMKERLEALQSHALTLSQCEDVTAVAKTTYKILHEIMDYSFFGLGLVDGDVLRFVPDLLVDGDGWSLEYPLSGPGICGRAVKTGSSIIVPDVRLDPGYIGPKSGLKYLSEVVVPVKIGGKVVAVINIEDEAPSRFTRDDVMLLEIFSEHVASSLHRINLINSTKSYLFKLENINRYSTNLANLRSVKEVAEYSFDVIQELIGFSDGCIGIVEGDVLKFKYARNPVTLLTPDLSLNGKGITVRAYRTGKSQLVKDTRLDPEFVKDVDPAEYLSELDVPVKIDGRVVAVINLEEREPDSFSEEDKEIVEILAENIASAISRIKQHKVIRKSKEALVKSEERFKYILDSAPEGVAVNIFTKIVYVNKHFANMMGYTVDELLQKNMVELHPEKYQKLIKDRTRRRALGEDVPPNYDVELIRKDGSIIPVEYSISRIVFEGEMASLTFIRDVSYKREKQALQNKIAALHNHAHALNELRGLEEVAKTTLDILHTHLKCNLLSIRSSDGENLTMLARWGANPYGKPLSIQGKGLIARAAREKLTLLVNDTRDDPDFLKGNNNALSEIVAPILCRGDLLGVLNAESRDLNAFGEDEKILMEALADEVSSAIMRINALELEHVYNQKLEVLQVNAIKLSQAGTIDEALDTTCEILEKIFGYNWVGIGRVGEESIHYVRVLGSGLGGNDKIPLDRRSITVRAVKSGATQLVPDTSKDEDYIVVNPGDATASSELVVPIRVNGRVEFVMNLESMKVDAFSDQEKHLIELLALHLGSAVELIRKREKLNSIHLHASRLGSVDDIGDIAKLTLDTLKEVLDFKICSFHLVKNEVVEMIETIGFKMESQFTQPLSGPGLIPYAVRECRPMYAPDVTCDEHYMRGPPLNLEDEQSSEFVVPIIIDGVSVAAINLEDKRKNGFTDEDQELVEILSEHVASAIYRIRELDNLKMQEKKKVRELMGGAEKIVSMVRNDLRTPLQRIQNASYLLKRKFTGAEEYTSKIDAGVEHAVKILDDLKTMMSLPQLKLKKLEYNDLVKTCLEDVKIPTSINVNARYGAPVLGEADSNKIRRVIDNLVKNAVEAMPDGGTLSVKVEAVEEMAILTIGDTGQGISDDIAHSMFTPFYTTKSEGTGLGLPICKQIVEAHGGRITFESKVREGTSFTVAIPLSPRILSDKVEGGENNLINSAQVLRPKKRKIDSHR